MKNSTQHNSLIQQPLLLLKHFHINFSIPIIILHFINESDFLFLLLLLVMLVLGDDANKATTTMVWATGTDSAGVLRTTQSPYFQKFTKQYSTTYSPSSGSVGMGSLSGKVGEIRLYERTTISEHNAGLSTSSNNVFVAISQHTKILMVLPLLTVGYILVM